MLVVLLVSLLILLLLTQSFLLFTYVARFSLLIGASDLGGGVLVAVRHLNGHVVHGASSRVEPAGDGDGSCVLLDIKVFLLVTTWKQDTEGQMK